MTSNQGTKEMYLMSSSRRQKQQTTRHIPHVLCLEACIYDIPRDPCVPATELHLPNDIMHDRMNSSKGYMSII